MRSLRRFTASNTVTVPRTLRSAPRGGSAAANGTCIAARWTTFVIPWSSSARSTAARSVTSPRTNCTRWSSSGSRTSSSRWRSSPRSNATMSPPSASTVFALQAPMQPSAPVMRKRSDVLVDSHDLGVELERTQNVLQLRLLHHRADLGLWVGRVADLAALDALEEQPAELVVHRVLDEDPPRRRAL